MDFFFEPNGIAVVGATPEPYHGGQYLVTNLSLGYHGPIYPVNPKYHEVLGLKCYPKVTDIDGPLDIALIFVPAQAVPQVLEECVMKGVRGAIVESSGFAEVGPEGKMLQDRCLAIARKGGLRIWGPNCMGYIDTSRRYVFSFIIPEAWKELMNPGHVSLIVQSGLLSAGFITTLMANKTLGLAKVCSIGNKSDVEETELLEYLLKDPETKVVALYLESFVKGRRFWELAASSNKPIVVLKGGKSALGGEAAASHTASLSGNHNLIEGVLKQAGIHQADDFFEMVDVARTLEKDFYLQQPPHGKPRIAILSYSGASGIVTTDHMEKYGLTLAHLSPHIQKRLEELSPSWMPVKNPVDYWPAMEKYGPVLTYKHAIEALHDDPEVDGIIVHLFAGFGIWFLNMEEIMGEIKTPRKPILFWLIGHEKGREPTRLTLEREGWPTFSEIHRTVRVMASLFEYKGRKSIHSKISPFDFINSTPLRERIHHADEQGIKILDEHESKKWFKAMGLQVVEEMGIKNLDEALKAADRLGYPVVLKGIIEGKAHKTELGLIRTNLWSVDQLASAYHEMLASKIKPKSFLVQPMLKSDLELIVGTLRDSQFGPSVMLGLGGIWTEIYKDTVFRLAPLNQEDVLEMISDLKGQALLNGYRGLKPINTESLGDWLIKLGGLALNFEKIKEIDVNPLLIVDGEPIAVDATIILQ
ncbi:MAG: acetate--CoA ligase family protein [Syntrophaceae bacterium]|nr:acetate--CoA ligase family protein [Syntrophaceae bacterium]